MDVMDVAEYLAPVSLMVMALKDEETDPSGPHHRAFEAWSLLWSCFEDNALAAGGTWTPEKSKGR